MKVSDIKIKINEIKTLDDLKSSPFQDDQRTGVQNALKSKARQLQKEVDLIEKYKNMMIYENEHYGKVIAGIDEAGRGPLAGEVVAAAVILPLDHDFLGLDDSKKIPAKRRDTLRQEILAYADVGLGVATPEEIDRYNIYEATKLAMKRAVDQLSVKPDHLLIDAMTLDNGIAQTSVIKGDAKSNSIAAASIIAKTTRDALMTKYGEEYPGYGFEQHMGYGTKNHLIALEEYGITPLHRKSFEPIKSKFL